MDVAERGWFLWPLVESLKRQAVGTRGVPDDVACAAVRAVAARFAEHTDSRLDSATQRRVSAYFWGTVRRRAIRHAPDYARRVVRAALTADLERAGWDAPSIRAELERAGLPA
jgi:hypothetical protein